MKRSASRRYTPYRLLDKFHPGWDNYDRRNNAIFVGLVLGELNDQLRENGVVTLNEALERLNFGGTETSEGDFEGWVFDGDPRYSDGHISFGIWDNGFSEGLDWLNGKVDVIKLRFNVDRVPLPVSLNMKKLRDQERNR